MTQFAVGDLVRIRDDFPPGHIRTPVYLRGKTGAVERCFGEFENPEAAAYRLSRPKKRVYQIRFAAADLWPDYDGSSADAVDVDIYEHWLEKL